MNNFEYFDIDKSMDIISENSSLVGTFYFGELARIEGSSKGEIHSKGTLIIGEKAKIKANIFGNEIIINGRLEGNIQAKKRTVVGSCAVINGNVYSPSLNIKNGAVINGQIIMQELISNNIKN